MLKKRHSSKRRASKPSYFQKCSASKHPSNQSKTSSNYGRATYLIHSSLTINSSSTSYFKASRSIHIAQDSTTTKILDHSLSLFFNGFLQLSLESKRSSRVEDMHVFALDAAILLRGSNTRSLMNDLCSAKKSVKQVKSDHCRYI